MDVLIPSFMGFLLGILSTFVIQKINEYRKLYLTISTLAFEIASNQEMIDLIRALDLEKVIQDDDVVSPPHNDIYEYVKDELTILPPHILQYITRYYLLIEKLNSNWEQNLRDKNYRETKLVDYLNSLENYSVGIMLNDFKPIIEARNAITRYYFLRKLLLSPTWLQKGKEHLDWKRYELVQEEIASGKNNREAWEPFIAKYRKSPPEEKE